MGGCIPTSQFCIVAILCQHFERTNKAMKPLDFLVLFFCKTDCRYWKKCVMFTWNSCFSRIVCGGILPEVFLICFYFISKLVFKRATFSLYGMLIGNEIYYITNLILAMKLIINTIFPGAQEENYHKRARLKAHVCFQAHYTHKHTYTDKQI